MENIKKDNRESEIRFMSTKKLRERVNKLLENKNIDFKRKYFLLSYLANSNIRENKHLMSEADCYINTLISTNGSLPKEKFVIGLVKEALKPDRKNYMNEVKNVIELNELINPKISNTDVDIIKEELDFSLNVGSYKINNKLKTILIESISKNISMLVKEMSGDGKTFDASDFLDSYIDDKKVVVPQSKNSIDSYIDSEEIDSEEIKKKRVSSKSFKAKEKALFKQYAFLLKKSNIPYIRNVLKLYLPVDEHRIGPNLEGVPDIDKLAIISKYKLTVEQKVSNAAMRKYNIIQQIYYYLNIQQKFMDKEIQAVGEKSLKKDKKRFTRSPSGLDQTQKDAIISSLNDIITKINQDDITSLDSPQISEDELLKLLNASAGSQSKNIPSFVDFIKSEYPDDSITQQVDVLSAEEIEELRRENEMFDKRIADQDSFDFDNSPIDPESGEPLYANIEQAARISKQNADSRARKNPETIEMHAKEAMKLFKQNSIDLKVVDKLSKIAKKKELPPAAQKALDDALKRLEDAESISISIIPDRTKTEIHVDLLDAMDHMTGINSIDKKSGRITSNQWEKFVEENIDTEGPMSSADIARVSQGAFRNTGGVRQDLTKQWFKSMFYSTDIDMKCEIYSVLGKKYIDAIRGMDLVEDAIVKFPGIAKTTSGDNKNFAKVESLITDKESLKDYFLGYDDSNEDYENLDELIGGLTSYRVFVTWYLKDFYANHVWNKAEAKLAFAVKEYFYKFHKNARIGENLKPGRQSKHVAHEFGKSIFNFIIYWTMGRTGIKDKGNVLPNPKIELDQRKAYFLKKIGSVIEEYNSFIQKTTGNASRTIQNFNPEQLMNDCLDERSLGYKSIIGSAWNELSMMNTKNESDFKSYVDSKSNNHFELKFVESAMMKEYWDNILNNPLTPLGNPAEIEAVKRGTGSESPIDKGQPASFEGAPYLYKLYKDAVKDKSKELSKNRDEKSGQRETSLSSSKDYSFLTDESLNVNSWQVIYKGKPVEVKDSVDIDSGKLEIIIDIFNSNGDVIDGEEKEVSINDVLPVKK